MKKENLHIGCSAFNNTYWKNIFYPEELPRSKWFDFYSENFSTYELNGTFYKAPTVKSLKNWHDKVPAYFRFSVKAPKVITHFKKFLNCKNDIDSFYDICHEGLQEKLACVLFQLPPSFDYSPEKLQLIIDSLNPDFKNVIEFRNKSWWTPVVFETLHAHQITLCDVSYPNLPEYINPTSEIGYIRLHGVPKLFYSEYTKEQLQQWYNSILEQNGWKEAYIYFNNTASAAGIENALQMKSFQK